MSGLFVIDISTPLPFIVFIATFTNTITLSLLSVPKESISGCCKKDELLASHTSSLNRNLSCYRFSPLRRPVDRSTRDNVLMANSVKRVVVKTNVT